MPPSPFGFLGSLGPRVPKGLVRFVLRPGNALLRVVSAVTSRRGFTATEPAAHSGPTSSQTKRNVSAPPLQSLSIAAKGSTQNPEIRFPPTAALKATLQKCLFFSFYRNSPSIVPRSHASHRLTLHLSRGDVKEETGAAQSATRAPRNDHCGWEMSQAPRGSRLAVRPEDRSEKKTHGSHTQCHHPTALWQPGDLCPFSATAVDADASLPPGSSGRDHRGYLWPGKRMCKSLPCSWLQAGALWQRRRETQRPGAAAIYHDQSPKEPLLPSMIKRRQGHIVAISSVQGKISIPFRSAYAASKHATQAFFDCLRAEVEQYDIDVTVVSPGYIQTNLSLNAVTADGSRYGVMDKNTAEGQTAAEVAQVVLNAVGQKKKEVLVAGLTPSLAVYLRNLFPRLFFTLMATRAKKERKAKDS
ncbi:dehydrogenase/reductase SDR family member 7B isoform X1 [Grus americana]|uniref:dehydrogenase/reductase SDR family member 7B isoform X1 n=1 Tax=Grus americana TaxID=9117 RepID=UPI002408257D|nr:dehydrogenase/reductase SDR family member 7B isoform X1 [Grus americana]